MKQKQTILALLMCIIAIISVSHGQSVSSISGYAIMGSPSSTLPQNQFASTKTTIAGKAVNMHSKKLAKKKYSLHDEQKKAYLIKQTIEKMKIARKPKPGKNIYNSKHAHAFKAYAMMRSDSSGPKTYCSGAGICSTSSTSSFIATDDAVSIPVTYCVLQNYPFISIGFSFSALSANQQYEVSYIQNTSNGTFLTSYTFNSSYPLTDQMFRQLGLSATAFIPGQQAGTINVNGDNVVIIMPVQQ